ncbi:hypothetical protein [Corynebacterium sp. TAE3-ERU2]|uniref:hypothetical protein n=1 Tax=Corynebacterium sp. TAE3-ERU2 TaxID=2849497 RepID=UPI001C483842|nr:hypothetical protein [Corynebacterium sp. TAE3-ERU2]MBV7301594.1 hypothetical protein [Corynebacterium sp. TAE3-ERU2]
MESIMQVLRTVDYVLPSVSLIIGFGLGIINNVWIDKRTEKKSKEEKERYERELRRREEERLEQMRCEGLARQRRAVADCSKGIIEDLNQVKEQAPQSYLLGVDGDAEFDKKWPVLLEKFYWRCTIRVDQCALDVTDTEVVKELVEARSYITHQIKYLTEKASENGRPLKPEERIERARVLKYRWDSEMSSLMCTLITVARLRVHYEPWLDSSDLSEKALFDSGSDRGAGDDQK